MPGGTGKAEGLPDLSGYSGVSIVDGLKSAGADSSYTYRKALAEKLEIGIFRICWTEPGTIKKVGCKGGVRYKELYFRK